jgi:hypothetical protein
MRSQDLPASSNFKLLAVSFRFILVLIECSIAVWTIPVVIH